jgi:hypothetical protein
MMRIIDKRITWPTTLWRFLMLVGLIKIIDLLIDIKIELMVG